MALEQLDLLVIRDSPEPDFAINTTSCQIAAIRAKRHRHDRFETLAEARPSQIGALKVDLGQLDIGQIRLPDVQIREVVATQIAIKLNQQIENIPRTIALLDARQDTYCCEHLREMRLDRLLELEAVAQL